MARTAQDARQTIIRRFLDQLAGRSNFDGTSDSKPASSTELDNLLDSLNLELTVPLRLSASNPIDRVVTVASGIIANTESSRNRAIPLVGSSQPSFTSGTVTFPASSGGTITVSPGNNGTLTVSSGNYIKVLIYLDASGNLNVLSGAENATEANATVVPAPANSLAVGYVTLHNTGGTIDTIAQTKIYQFAHGQYGSDVDLSPLRLYANNPATALLNIAAYEVSRPDGSGAVIPAISSQILAFAASTINFQTGATTGGTIDITFPASTTNYYRRVGLTLIAGNTLKALFTAEASTLVAVANAGTVFIEGGIPVGWIDIQCTSGTAYKTADSATSVVENSVSGSPRVHLIASGGGASSGSGSGTGDDINVLQFKASFTDNFRDLPGATGSAVDYSAGLTPTLAHDIANTYHRLSYDASKTVAAATTTTTLNISSNAAYTVAVGDLAIYGTEVRRITAVGSQSSFTTEAFSVAPTLAGQVTISQAVYTKDINNFAGDGLAISSAFSTTLNQCLVTYEDTAALNDIIFDNTSTPLIAFTASSDGSSYTSKLSRVGNITDTAAVVDLPSSGTNMYLRFFSNATSSSGAVNILGYKAFFHKDTNLYADGGILDQAYCFTDGTGTEINCSAPTVVSGKTRVTLSFTYPVGSNSGKTNGSIAVYLNGAKIPRFVDATLTPDAYYKEINANVIELNDDYSGSNLSLEIVKEIAMVDASSDNGTNISYLQNYSQAGFQGFVDETARLNATTATGSPAAGTFHSVIVGRAQIPDLNSNLRVQLGIERIAVQQIMEIQNEVGPSGQRVWGVLNDDKGLIRLIGGDWSNITDANGSRIAALNNFADPNTAIEITFYGTGLNILSFPRTGVNTWDVDIDGVASTAVAIMLATSSAVNAGRNYAGNEIHSITSGLALGVHTVKLKGKVGNSTQFGFHGFEILNESSTLKVNPGTSYVNGKKLALSSQQSPAFASSFESGTLGTKGGRVVVYQKSDGTIAKALTPTDTSQLNLASASHTNEEVMRVYQPREFGAGRADDIAHPTATNVAFTLDDGVTTLVGSTTNWNPGFGSLVNQLDWSILDAGATYATFTFIGTGLDIVWNWAVTAAAGCPILVDGVSIGTFTESVTAGNIIKSKIVSGLPYGTHTVKFGPRSSGTTIPGLRQLIVYGPKKPSIPSGAVELADYNLVADYSNATATGTAVADNQQMPIGVLAKATIREVTLTGSWGALVVTDYLADFGPFAYVQRSNAAANYVEYTFFGTGVHLHFRGTVATVDFSVTIDGVANASGVSVVDCTNSGSGNYSYGTTVGSGAPKRLQFTGLSLAKHTIRITHTDADSFGLVAIDVISPIHSPKANLYGDIQNTLPVGSCALSDNRKISPVKEVVPATKAWAQATGISSSPTSTSTAFVPMPDMSLAVKVLGNSMRVKFNSTFAHGSSNGAIFMQIYVDGAAQSEQLVANTFSGTGQFFSGSIEKIIPVAPGVHKVDIFWKTNTGTMTAQDVWRTLIVEEK